MISVFGEDKWDMIRYYTQYDIYSSKFNYTYVVPTSRLHSNANSITKKSNGYYYHTWQINANNIDEQNNSIIQIEYWTVTANKAVWYVITLLISGIVISCVYLKARKQEQQKAKEFKLN